MQLKQVVVALSLMGAFACGNGGTFNGTVSGNSLSVKDAVFSVTRVDGKIQYSNLILADAPNLCTSLRANRNPKSVTVFAASFVRSNVAGEVLATDVGDYTVVTTYSLEGGTRSSIAAFFKTDANCTTINTEEQGAGKSGIIKISEYNPSTEGKMSGTFDITFGEQNDKVSGSFSADYCDVPTFATEASCE